MKLDLVGVRRLCSVVVLGVATTLGAASCDMGLQKTLDEKKAARFKEAAEKLSEIQEARRKAFLDALPAADAKAEGRVTPMLGWRYQAANLRIKVGEDSLTYEEALLRLSEQYKGTPTEQAARDSAAFAKESAEFWGHAEKNNYGRMRQEVGGYVKYLKGYATAAAEAAEGAKDNPDFVQRVFLTEAAFDIAFVHFGVIEAGTNMVPFLELAFHFEGHGGENLGQYVTRLCQLSEIRDKCKTVPAELRVDAIRKPYFEWLQKTSADFRAAHKVDVYNSALARYDAKLVEALKLVPDLTEDPVMPASLADRAASAGLTLRLSAKDGAALVARNMAPLEFGTFSGKAPAGLGAKLTEKITELKATENNAVDYETVVFEAPGSISVGTVKDVMTAFPLEFTRKVDLAARRRIDDSMKRVGVLLRLPDEAGKIESYSFTAGAEERTKCAYVGYGGKLGRRTKAGFSVVVDKARVRAIEVARNEETQSLEPTGALLVDSTEVTEATLDKLADDKNFRGNVRLFISEDFTYDEMMRYMTALMYDCADVEIRTGPRLETIIKIQCGNTEQRDVTLAVAICGK